jgi:hypothetical protein
MRNCNQQKKRKRELGGVREVVSAVELDRVRAVKATHEAELLRKANVVGVGVGLRSHEGRFTDELAIVVSVRQKLPRSALRAQDVIPVELDGVPVDVQELGILRAGEPAAGLDGLRDGPISLDN